MKYITYILCLGLALVACSKYEAPFFDSENIGFNSKVPATISYFEDPDNRVQASNIPVNIFGSAPATDISYEFEIAAGSEVEEGFHYNITGPGIIPANSTSATLPIEILTQNFELNEPKRIIVRITSNFVDGFQERTFFLKTLCPSNINTTGSYIATISVHPGFGPPATTNPEVTITRIQGATYKISDVSALFMEPLCCPGCNAESVILEDFCGSLTITDPNPDNNNCFNWVSPRPGSFNISSGVITLPVQEGEGRLEMVIRLTPN